MKLTKEDFIVYMKELIDLDEKAEKLGEALEGLSPDSYHYCQLTSHHSMIMRLLVKVMDDTDNWIEYWYYEMDKGKNLKPKSVEVHGKPVNIKTLGGLYEIVVK